MKALAKRGAAKMHGKVIHHPNKPSTCTPNEERNLTNARNHNVIFLREMT
jgi:hypothetical protein